MAALTILGDDDLDDAISRLGRSLYAHSLASIVFQRIAASRAVIGGNDGDWHAAAIRLAADLGMCPLAEAPEQAYSWDGGAVRTVTEPAVLIHEIAHFQLAGRDRRTLPDFGLGAGPETGLAALADAVRVVPDVAREREEQLASLLGVLWEVELNQPAILAFQEQNWLEGAGRASTAAFFAATLDNLRQLGLVDDDGRPVHALSLRTGAPADPSRNRPPSRAGYSG